MAYFRDDAVGCCGVLNQMEAAIERDGTLALQVWRPDGTGSYTLIGITYTQCGGGGEGIR